MYILLLFFIFRDVMTKTGTKCTAHEKLEFYLKNPDKNKSFLQNKWPNDCDEVLQPQTVDPHMLNHIASLSSEVYAGLAQKVSLFE